MQKIKKRILLLHSRYQNLIQFCVSCKRYCHKSCMNHVRTCSNRLGNRFTCTNHSTKQKVLWCSFDVGENEEFLLMSWDVLLRSNGSAKSKSIACCFEVGEKEQDLLILRCMLLSFRKIVQQSKGIEMHIWCGEKGDYPLISWYVLLSFMPTWTYGWSSWSTIQQGTVRYCSQILRIFQIEWYWRWLT